MRPLVDICMVLNYAERLLPLHYDFWKSDTRVRFLIGSTTPLVSDLPSNARFVPIHQSASFDGTQHGHGIDQLIAQSDAEYVILQDPDVFWLKADTMNNFLEMNIDCLGIGDVYYSLLGVFPATTRFPNQGMLSTVVPFCSGMIAKRETVLDETFALTYQECQETKREVGWRIRDRMWQSNLKVRGLLGFCYPPGSPQSLPHPQSHVLLGSPPVYGSPDSPWAIHFTQYYFRTYSTMGPLTNCLRNCSGYWASILPPID